MSYVLKNAKTKEYMAVGKEGDTIGFAFVKEKAEAWVVPTYKFAEHYRNALKVLTGDKIVIEEIDG